MPPKKYESGCEKRKRKKRIEKLIQSQKGALNKFLIKEPQQIPIENENVDNVDVGVLENVVTVQDIENESVDPENRDDVPIVDDVNLNNFLDIFDPRNWDALDSKMIDLLAMNGPKRDLSVVKGPRDKLSRRFTTNLYTRVLPNGEKCDRDWLVYSKELDRVFCFCCKVYKRWVGNGQLTNEGFSDWSHVSERLREHETSMEHVKNMTTWYELRQRMQKNQTIDKTSQRLLQKEKDHWINVLKRIIAIVKFLAKYNLAFRGSKEKLYESSNGNFLGLIEMLAEFDPIVQEHVRRITHDDLHFHYLGHNIQNELILLLSSGIKTEIIRRIKQAKYFSVILDCTPDVSHQEQMSLIIRYVDVSSNSVSIEESFLGFLNVNDTTGQGLFDVLQNELKNFNLDIFDVRGQGYDNGSNMKGKHQGVQKKFLDINSRERIVLDQLDHPGIVRLYFTFQDTFSLYMALESCEGGELFDQITRKSRLTQDEAQFYAAEVVDALEYIHSLGVIHRDIKPENLLLTTEGHIKIADFGSVKPMQDSQITVLPNAASDDKACTFVGTAAYVPPEVLNSSPATFGNDLWALGCTLYQMLSGTSPFKDASEWLIFQRIIAREIRFPDYFSDEARDLIDRLLDLDPSRRPGAGPDGYAILKSHPFFKGVDWNNLRAQTPPKLALEPGAGTQSPADDSQESSWSPAHTGDGSAASARQPDGATSSSEGAGSITRLASIDSFDSKWQQFLEPGESVLMISMVKKLQKITSKKVQLILTNKPKLIYVDPSKLIVKGNIIWSDNPNDLSIQVTSPSNFKICTPKKVMSFEDAKQRASQWKKAIEGLQNR